MNLRLFAALALIGCSSGSSSTSHDLSVDDLSAGDLGMSDLAESADLTKSVDMELPTFTLTVNVTGVDGAGGSVVTSPSSALGSCTSSCSVTLPYGDHKLVASPANGFYFKSWTGCTPDATNPLACTITLNSPATVTATFTPANLAFVTSASFTPAALTTMGSGDIIAGANAACQAAGPGGGTGWVGWLSSSAHNAIDGLSGARGWVRKDGLPFADAPNTLAVVQVYYPLEIDEHGASPSPSPVPVLTGTGFDGKVFTGGTGTCTNWTVTGGTNDALVGTAEAGGSTWTFGSFAACNGSYHLYCFQTKYQAVVPALPRPANSRLAFMTTGRFGTDFAAGIGPASTANTADALCAKEASGAGVSGTFKALLATTGASAASRFTLPSGVPLVRPDGVVIVDDYATIFSSVRLRAPIAMTLASGNAYFYGGQQVLTGAHSPTAVATNSCGDWTGTAGNGDGAFSGETDGSFFFFHTNGPCTAGWPIYCLQAD